MRFFSLLSLLFIISLTQAQPYQMKEITMTTPFVKGFTPYDFDDDGDLDIISVDRGATLGSFFWMENDGLGNIIAKHAIQTNQTGVSPIQDILISDMNNDHLFDLLTIHNYAQDGLSYLKQESSGDFTVVPVYVDTVDIEQITVHDMDSDGDNDIVFVDEVKVGWIENMGNGTFSTPHLILTIPDLSCMASSMGIWNNN